MAAGANIAIAKLDEAIGPSRAAGRRHARSRPRARQALAAGRVDLPLFGVPVGIKDVFDTSWLPTEYGSPIYRGHQPRSDAALVGLLSAAGAVMIGKTKTSEFAFLHPGDTRNPLDPDRTPGGSSSGSAAAVPAPLVPLATGTQTAGSVVRPASYAACSASSRRSAWCRSRAPCRHPPRSTPPGCLRVASTTSAGARRGLGHPPAWRAHARPAHPRARARAGGRATLPRGSASCGSPGTSSSRSGAKRSTPTWEPPAAGASSRKSAPGRFRGVIGAQITIQLVETAWSFGREADWHGELVSAELRAYIAAGRAITREQYLAARRLADQQRWSWDDRIGGFDGVSPRVRSACRRSAAIRATRCSAGRSPCFAGPRSRCQEPGPPRGCRSGCNCSERPTPTRLLDVAHWLSPTSATARRPAEGAASAGPRLSRSSVGRRRSRPGARRRSGRCVQSRDGRISNPEHDLDCSPAP